MPARATGWHLTTLFEGGAGTSSWETKVHALFGFPVLVWRMFFARIVFLSRVRVGCMAITSGLGWNSVCLHVFLGGCDRCSGHSISLFACRASTHMFFYAVSIFSFVFVEWQTFQAHVMKW
jgi:hypothetical protein